MAAFISVIAFVLLFFLTQVGMELAQFKTLDLGALFATAFAFGRFWLTFWVSKRIYRTIKGGQPAKNTQRDLWLVMNAEIHRLAESDSSLKMILPTVRQVADLSKNSLMSELVASTISPEQMAANLFANQAGDDLEAGRHHLYRGTLTPTGQALLKFYRVHWNAMADAGVVTHDTANEQIRVILANIRRMG